VDEYRYSDDDEKLCVWIDDHVIEHGNPDAKGWVHRSSIHEDEWQWYIE
jgi:hypothetical protein